MPGPWEDFQQGGDGPWTDFQSPKTTTKAEAKDKDGVTWRTAAEAAGIPVGYALDAGMGIKQALDAVAQMAARGAEGAANKLAPESAIARVLASMRQDTEGANKTTLNAYNRVAEPDTRTGAAFVRGIGQSTPLLFAPQLAAGGVLRSAATGAATGAAGGLLEPVYDVPKDEQGNDAFWSAKGKQAATGAAAGGVLGGAGSVVAKAIAPRLAAEQAILSREGVNMTPGQAIGGALKDAEDKLTSVPIIGNLIQSGRMRGIEDFNRAVYARATEPFGQEGATLAAKASVGREGVAKIGDYLSSKYEAALAKSKPSPYDNAMNDALDNLATMIPQARAGDFQNVIKRELFDKFTPANTITPSVAKQADSEIGRLAREYAGSASGDDRLYGQALREVQSQVRQLFARSNPDTAPLIKAADQGWATLTQMERAASMVGARDGIFTPAQFLNAVKRGDASLRDRKFARGEALNQDLADAAKNVLPSTVPDSGTPGRALMALLAGGGGAHMIDPSGLSVAATGLAALPYLPGIGPLLTKAALSRPEGATSLRELAQGALPLLGMAAGNAFASGEASR